MICCVESYQNELQKKWLNLLYWQVTCRKLLQSKRMVDSGFKKYNYSGDYSFIYFN